MTAGADTTTTDTEHELQKLRNQLAACEETLDNIGAYIFTKDLKGRYTFANKMVRELFGRDSDGIIGHDDTEFFSLEISDNLIVNDRLVMERGQIIEAEELNVIALTGETRYYKTVKKPLRNEDGVIIGMCGISTDVTQYRILEKELQEKQKLLDTVLANVDACIYMKDSNRRYLYINERTAHLFGRPVNEVLGKTDTELLDKKLSAHLGVLDNKVFTTGTKQVGEESFVDQQGAIRKYLTTKVPIVNSEGGIISIIGFSHDVTEFIELKQKLERMAQTDELTQIANRRHFLEIAERDFRNARRYASPLCVMVFDVDLFKSINDTYGHHIGDTVLKAIAKTAVKSIRESDFIGRIGGEEFAVVLPHTHLKSAANLAERLRKKINQLSILSDQSQSVSTAISVGVVEINSEDKRFEDMLIRADRKLYQAKIEGRNRVCR